MAARPSPRGNVTRSLERAIGLLRLLASHTHFGWRLSDLAAHTGLDPATVHRLLAGLCAQGLVMRVPGSRHYTLGALAFELGLAAAPYFDFGQHVHTQLAALARALQGSIFLKLRSGAESVCLARHDGTGPVPSLMLDVGGRRPLCLTAGGLAMVIGLPRAEQTRIVADNRRDIKARNALQWVGVRRMLERSRPLGFALNLGDIATGISAVGVALCAPSGQPVASLTLAVAGAVPTAAQARETAQRLRAEAAQLEPLLARLRIEPSPS